jgi:hypothetical protein
MSLKYLLGGDGGHPSDVLWMSTWSWKAVGKSETFDVWRRRGIRRRIFLFRVKLSDLFTFAVSKFQEIPGTSRYIADAREFHVRRICWGSLYACIHTYTCRRFSSLVRVRYRVATDLFRYIDPPLKDVEEATLLRCPFDNSAPLSVLSVLSVLSPFARFNRE